MGEIKRWNRGKGKAGTGIRDSDEEEENEEGFVCVCVPSLVIRGSCRSNSSKHNNLASPPYNNIQDEGGRG